MEKTDNYQNYTHQVVIMYIFDDFSWKKNVEY